MCGWGGDAVDRGVRYYRTGKILEGVWRQNPNVKMLDAKINIFSLTYAGGILMLGRKIVVRGINLNAVMLNNVPLKPVRGENDDLVSVPERLYEKVRVSPVACPHPRGRCP
jgi:hypothetical protein